MSTARILVVDLDDPEALADLAARLRPLLAPEADDRRLLTTSDAASRLGVHPKTLERWCRDGRAPGAVKIGRGWRLPAGALAGIAQAVPARDVRRPAPRRARSRRDRRNDAAANAIRGFPS